MSLDLYQDEIRDQLAGMPPVTRPEAGAFDGFIRGTGLATMRGFARAARVVDLAGSVGPIAQDALMGTGTEAQDRYFKEHDDVYGSAVQHWAPEPGEVGAAADVVGGLLSTIPLVLLSPGLAAASTADIGEELVQKGVPAGKAAGVATAQAAGMALGIWMPVLGQNLWQRVFIGGAGFNALQGVTMRGASGAILEGTPAADEFKAFDGKQLTLDALMGMAFGTLAHISPAQRAQGEVYWDRLLNWAKDLDPSQKDAVLALRQAEHMNVDSAPGKLAGPQDVEAHVQRMRQAIDQLAKGDQVAVDDLPAPKFDPDARKTAAAEKTVADMQKIAEKVRVEEGIVAYHGSPHDFEAFDISKIGTGEGAQSFGHGLYFAENKNVAETYRLVGSAGASLGLPDGPAHGAATLLMAKGPDAGEAMFRKHYANLGEEAVERSLREAKEAIAEHTVLYKVQVPKHVIEGMLDWDKPLSQQPQTVRAAIAKLLPEFEAEQRAYEAAHPDNAFGEGKGREMYRALAKKFGGSKVLAQDVGGGYDVPFSNDEAASEAMRKEGVFGIRYLDQGSRADREGTRNFVLFDASLAKIIEKNGQQTEAPAAEPGGTEPPPPRGSRGAEAAGAEADPVAMEAQRLATEQPDLRLNLGTTADGQPITATAKQFLEDTKAETSKLREQAKLVMVAAQCMLGVL